MRRAFGAQTGWDSAATLLVALVVGAPAIFTYNGFGFDYTNHMWMVWVQEQAISQHLVPSYFLNTPSTGIFFPQYIFYGATLYGITGGVAALLGGRVVVAFVGTSVASVIAAYGGMVWLARQLGVRGWLAHAPALTFVAGAYYVTNLYGRGAWTEFVATSMLPLVAASGLHLLRASRVRLSSCVLFVVAMVVFAGSHNITLLLGTIMLVVVAAVLVAAIGRTALPGRHRVVLVAMLALASVAVNAWFLLPDLVHSGSTQIASSPPTPWANTTEFNTFATMFNPLRMIPRGSILPALYVQAPVWFLVWSLLAGAAFWRRAAPPVRRVGAALAVLLVLVLVCIMAEPVWNALPRTIQEIQFPFRLDTYVALLIAGLVITGALMLQSSPAGRRRQGLAAGLGVAALVSCVLCVWQLWVPNTRVGAAYANWHGVFVSTHVTPATWNSSGIYNDVSAPIVKPTGGMLVDPNLITGDSVTLMLNPPSGVKPFAMNMGAGSYVVRIRGGLERVGRDTNNDVVVRRRFRATGPVRFTLATADGSIAVGRIVSVVTIVGLLLALVTALGRQFVRRRRRPIVPTGRRGTASEAARSGHAVQMHQS